MYKYVFHIFLEKDPKYNVSLPELLTITLHAPNKDTCFERIHIEKKFGFVEQFLDWLRERPMPVPLTFDLNAFTPRMLYEVLSREDSEFYCQLETDDLSDFDADEEEDDEDSFSGEQRIY